MLPKPSRLNANEVAADFQYEGVEADAIADGMHELMRDRGYRLTSGVPASGLYSRGSSFWGLSMGSLAGRQSFLVRVTNSGDGKDSILHIENGLASAVDAAVMNGRIADEYESIVRELREGVADFGKSKRKSKRKLY